MWKTLFPEIINFYIKLGNGERAMGNGQWELNKFFESNARSNTIFSMPPPCCAMPDAQCPMPHAHCPNLR